MVQQDKQKRYEYTCRWRPDWTRVLAEGDSWFDYPLADDVIDHIGGVRFRYQAYCLAEKGDRLDEIAKSGEWFPKLQDVNPKYILFSGGGNDLIKTYLPDLLNDRSAVRGKAGIVRKARLNAALKALREMYVAMVVATNAMRPKTPILGHGYDYIVPNGKGAGLGPFELVGPWVEPVMEGKGIDDMEERCYAMGVIMDGFNGMLEDVAGHELKDKNYTYIDCRGTLSEDDWNDEIHPNTGGFEKIATRFVEHMA